MPSSVFPNDELVAAARAGSSDAMGLLLQSCRTYLLAIGESELSAELRIKVSPSDLVQETFAEGQRAMPNFSGNKPEEFLAWLRGILMHKVAHSRRRFLGTAARDLGREERRPNHSSILALAERIVDEDTPSGEAMREENNLAVQAALARLPKAQREVILLRNFKLLSFDDMSRILDRSEGALRALWLRAIKRLKGELRGHDTAE
ncbi:MAG TPA: sigma-70 family RNA polymerase sigma factor [Pirellulales bacterium]|jgi:RNA polymerase sigma-70 factor (ECF subfamily)